MGCGGHPDEIVLSDSEVCKKKRVRIADLEAALCELRRSHHRDCGSVNMLVHGIIDKVLPREL